MIAGSGLPQGLTPEPSNDHDYPFPTCLDYCTT